MQKRYQIWEITKADIQSVIVYFAIKKTRVTSLWKPEVCGVHGDAFEAEPITWIAAPEF